MIVLVFLFFLILVFLNFHNNIRNDYFQRSDPVLHYTPRTKETKEWHVVPLQIFQTWNTRKLPPKMSECVERLKQMNPEFDHYLFDDADCRDFIKENFDTKVVWAYDQLIPGAYKADLWRYCVLYKMGGIYLDIKFKCEPDFSLMELTKDPETFVLDRPYEDLKMTVDENISIVNSHDFYTTILNTKHEWWSENDNKIGLYNAVMASIPNNPIFYTCIQEIVKNVQTKYYGDSPLSPTGPILLGKVFYKDKYTTKVKQLKYFNSIEGTYVINKKRKVLTHFPEYRKEQRQNNVDHYHVLWTNKKIYK